MPIDDETLDTHLETPSTQPSRRRPPDPPSSDPNFGRRIGPYRIQGLLGRGGMGAVYLAAREDDYQKQVALKLVHPDLQTAEVLRRFYAERQILAGLEHPNIARLLDGGTTDDALPFLVMEYVDGEPVDAYCRRRDLSTEARLELFAEICRAVHAAHQKLVVHRDLKPSNILVTEDGIPKLLDFGIAKLLEPDTLEAPQQGRLMTRHFASPEQLLGQVITTASDVYALGVLLHLLLTGKLPARGQGEDGIPRLNAVSGKLRGDLEAIVRKALCVDPSERYASALQFAADVRRHLEHRPVLARPGDGLYQARKFVRRYRAGVVVALLVIALAITSTFQWRRAVEQRAAAERAQARAQTVADFLEDLFGSADPNVAQGEDMTLLEALEEGRKRLEEELVDEPEIRADLFARLGTVYHNRGLLDDALQLKERALEIRQTADSSDRADLAADLNNLGRLHYSWGEFDAAERRYVEALEMWKRLGDEENQALASRNLGALAIQRRNTAQALRFYESAVQIDERLYGRDDSRVAASLYGLGASHRMSGDARLAEDYLRQARDIYQRQPASAPLRVATVEGSLGLALHAQGRLDEARELLERALHEQRRILDEDHPRVANSEVNLAALLLDQGEAAAAEPLLRQARKTLQASMRGDWSWRLADVESVWGSYLAAVGRRQEALVVLHESWRTLVRLKGAEHPHTREARRRLQDVRDRSAADAEEAGAEGTDADAAGE